MKEQLQKTDMVVGKEYKGYAWRNEYGEFFFRPAAEGSRAGRIKKICAEEDFTLSTTKENVVIHIRLSKSSQGALAYVSALGKIVDKLIKVFYKYEI